MLPPSSRLLEVLSLLQTGRELPGSLLAERLGISPRTVRRDVDRLRRMGYNIATTMGPDGGYRLAAGGELPPLLFDDDQVVALTIALRAQTFPGSGIEEAALRALATLRQVMPSRLRHRLDAVRFTPMPRLPGEGATGPVLPEVLVELSATVRDRQVLRFDYARPASQEPSRHRVEPHGLVTENRRWYLLAWDLERDDWRIYRADRITPRPPHGARFVPRDVPGGSVSGFVSARFKGSDREDRWPCEGTVILGRPVRDVLPFAGDGTVEDLGDGRCLLRSGSWSWAALAASLARFDASIEVVEPPELAEAFDVLARRAATAAQRTAP